MHMHFVRLAGRGLTAATALLRTLYGAMRLRPASTGAAWFHFGLLVAALFAGSAPAHASFPATQTNSTACTVAQCYQYKLSGWWPDRPWFSSVAEVCADYAVAYNAGFPAEYATVKIVDTVTPKCVLRNVTLSFDMSGLVSLQSATPATPTYSCPANSKLTGNTCTCNADFVDAEIAGSCVAAPLPAEPETSNLPQSCTADGLQTARPIIPATGEKVLDHSDYAGEGPDALSLVRSLRSARVVGAVTGAATAGLGQTWSHNHHSVLKQTGTAGTASSSARIHFGSGSLRAFSWSMTANAWVPVNSADSLSANSTGLQYKRLDDDSQWQFDAAGKLLSVTQRNGWTTRYSYTSAGLLSSVANQFGRTLSFTYNANNQLSSVTAPDGHVISYGHDGSAAASRLSSVSYPGSTGGTVSKTYLYENASFPQLVSGIIDESGNRLATISYDSQGRAVSSGYAGGADLYSVSYPATAGAATTVTDPLGTQRTYNYGTSKGKLAVTGADKPSGSGAGDAASRVQNAAGLIDSETDFLGVNTMYTWDINRRLPLTTTKAAGRPEAQTRTTQWHATFRLPVLITEAGRSTAYSYDNFGNKLTETITDTATGQARTWAWTYNAQGLADTLTDPKGGVWRFTYDSQGNLVSSKNPLGQPTSYSYDTAGRVTSQTDPNGLLTSYAYDARGRLTAQARGSETSSFSYTPTGQLASATLPSGYQVIYSYDAAQRLIAAQDNRGSSVQYTLDAMGNRIREEVKDGNGNIALATGKVINSLNRVAAIQGARGQTTALAYDANGEPVSATDPLNQTTRQTLDALRRPLATTFADNTQASQAWNQLDQLTQVTDPKRVQTSYQPNAFGEVVGETSPDIGTLSYQRDANGEVTGMRDAVGNSTTLERDALGRPILVQYAADHIASFSYDANQAGYPNKIEDKSGSTTYERDLQGRILGKSQLVNDNPNSPSLFKVGYGRANGELTSISYASGLKVFYQRTAGRITGIGVQAPGRNKPITPFVSSLAYTALNQPKAWRWSNGDAANRSFDSDGRMTGTEFASYQFDAASRITGITQNLWAINTSTTGPTGTASLYIAPLSWTAGYDSRNRLTSLARAGSATSYSYDANSNRLTAITKTTSDTDLDGLFEPDDFTQTTSQALNIDPASNRLLGLTHTISKTQAGKATKVVTSPVNYSLDANGAMTSDGLRTFEYDASRRLSKVKVMKDGEAASISYLHNALGQRVFKSEPQAQNHQPDEAELGAGFIGWLRKNFHWLFAQAQANTSLGSAYVYGDAELGEHSLLGEYDNGSASGKGRTEYLWLPTEGGSSSIPVGMYRNGKFFAIHSDHLGTPRLITNEDNKPVWQWPYSAFGDNKPTGILKATQNPKQAVTNQPTMLKATTPTEFNLRFAGQYFDEESNLSYNYYRSYCPTCGRYTQPDPIGLDGGLNPFAYVEGNPLSLTDPKGLMGGGGNHSGRQGPPTIGPFGCIGLACLSSTPQDSEAQMSLELTLGGGIEICDPPKPAPPKQSCPKQCGRFDQDCDDQPQPPGVPVPTRFGGAFIGPSIKADGRMCVRIGPHISVPFVPSLDLGGVKR